MGLDLGLNLHLLCHEVGGRSSLGPVPRKWCWVVHPGRIVLLIIGTQVGVGI